MGIGGTVVEGRIELEVPRPCTGIEGNIGTHGDGTPEAEVLVGGGDARVEGRGSHDIDGTRVDDGPADGDGGGIDLYPGAHVGDDPAGSAREGAAQGRAVRVACLEGAAV